MNIQQRSIAMTSGEKIMVCVSHVANGEQLIHRGGELSKLLQCPLYVLSVSYGEDNQAKSNNDLIWKSKSDEWGATLLVQSNENKKTCEVIAETAKRYNITQLIIGQSPQTRWQEIMNGSIVNELLYRLNEVDIHIVSLHRSYQLEQKGNRQAL